MFLTILAETKRFVLCYNNNHKHTRRRIGSRSLPAFVQTVTYFLLLFFGRKCWSIWKTRRTWAFFRVWPVSCSHAGNCTNTHCCFTTFFSHARQKKSESRCVVFVSVFWIWMRLRGRTKPRGWGWWQRRDQVSFTIIIVPSQQLKEVQWVFG